MDKFVARQPIFDAKQNVFAYELLFRSGMENFFHHDNIDQAASSVIADSFLLFDMNSLTGGKRVFLNSTRETLIKGYVAMLPREQAVVEILEGVEPDAEVIAACQELKKAGYMIALDDFVYTNKIKPLTDLADIIKVDFLATPSPEERKGLVDWFSPKGIKMLAEKVETREEFEQAVKQGYKYFQGAFFSMPQIIPGKDVPAFKLNYLRIVEAVNQPNVDLGKIEGVIKQEASLTYKLLRYLNSAFFGLRSEIKSIRHALTYLGLREVKRWVSLIATAGMGEDKPAELVVSALIRAKFCESIGGKVGMQNREADLFLMGMFSLMDVILDRPMASILAEIPISEDIKTALLQGKNRLRDVYDAVLAYEKGDWEAFSAVAAKLKLNENDGPDLYVSSVKWAKEVFQL